MIALTIPGFGALELQHLVLDYNGTLAVDGKLIRGLRDDTLRQRLETLLQISEGAGSPITQVATRVGDALKTARSVRRS